MLVGVLNIQLEKILQVHRVFVLFSIQEVVNLLNTRDCPHLDPDLFNLILGLNVLPEEVFQAFYLFFFREFFGHCPRDFRLRFAAVWHARIIDYHALVMISENICKCLVANVIVVSKILLDLLQRDELKMVPDYEFLDGFSVYVTVLAAHLVLQSVGLALPVGEDLDLVENFTNLK